MNLLPIIAVTTEDLGNSHSVMDALPHLAGMLMVIVTLTILWGLTVLVSKIIALLHPKPAAVTVPAANSNVAAGAPPAAHAGIAPEIVAVIAAAVAATTGRSHRVISIKPMSTSWEKAGRQSVLTSHRIR